MAKRSSVNGVIMQLIPSFVRGCIIAKSVGRLLWDNGRHCNDIAFRSFRCSTCPINYGGIAQQQQQQQGRFASRHTSIRSLFNSNEEAITLESHEDKDIASEDEGKSDQLLHESTGSSECVPVWNHPAIQARVAKKKLKNKLRFRQHVNPLSRMYQQPTILPDQWPSSVYTTVQDRPLHLDIGCGKGGFLIDLCQSEKSANSHNYLGLEIRPGVATYAKNRITVHQLKGHLDFLGCNANVDLNRVLNVYQSHYSSTSTPSATNSLNLCLHRVSIQFPDPHFKTQHMKRRVVTKKLVDTIAKYMPTNGTIILQSDIQPVLDDMRRQFREATVTVNEEVVAHDNNESEDVNNHSVDSYFIDSISAINEYVPENSLGVPTERELSVLVQELPVYRSLLTRSDVPYQNNALEA